MNTLSYRERRRLELEATEAAWAAMGPLEEALRRQVCAVWGVRPVLATAEPTAAAYHRDRLRRRLWHGGACGGHRGDAAALPGRGHGQRRLCRDPGAIGTGHASHHPMAAREVAALARCYPGLHRGLGDSGGTGPRIWGSWRLLLGTVRRTARQKRTHAGDWETALDRAHEAANADAFRDGYRDGWAAATVALSALWRLPPRGLPGGLLGDAPVPARRTGGVGRG